MSPNFFEIFGYSEILMLREWEHFRTFVVCKDKGFEFYGKIIELGPPTL